MSLIEDDDDANIFSFREENRKTYLDVQEVANLEADSRAMDRRIIVDGSVIAHIGPHCKRYRFRLNNLQKLSYYWECTIL